MLLQNCLLLVLSIVFIISTTPFQPNEDSALKLSPIPNIVKPIFPPNASISQLDVSTENVLNIRCDGETYGYNPNIPDCEDAKEYLVPDTKMWTFGERHTGLPEPILPLPYRLMGDRGLCYVQTLLIGDHTTAKASISMLRRAASSLLLQCVTSVTSQGGIATNIGGDNNLAVVLGTYQQPVSCRGSLLTWDSCRDIIYDMPADKVSRIFGPHGDPSVTEELPYHIDSANLECSANIFSTGKPDVASFYEMWEAVTAISDVCTRYRQAGSARGLGEHGNIFITMTKNERLGLPNISSSGDSLLKNIKKL
ncbi:MAG: hypothetical protein ASARMPRED_006380 [Alectoria sarmentosa]|nr:MAG: hypothetical protein ASARMPRED_006380 [Alectoria sarmentosa]